MNTYQFEYSENGIDVPSSIRSEPFGSSADLSRHSELELVVGNFEERQQFPDEYPNVLLVDQSV
jgi:hypothetical protein